MAITEKEYIAYKNTEKALPIRGGGEFYPSITVEADRIKFSASHSSYAIIYQKNGIAPKYLDSPEEDKDLFTYKRASKWYEVLAEE